MKNKILILENSKSDYTEMYNPLNTRLGNYIEIFPKLSNVNDITSFYYFVEKYVQVSAFKEIIDYYNDIDLFILDISLKGDSDKIGLDFSNFLMENNYRKGDYNIIYVSSAYYAPDKLNEQYVAKTESNYYYRIVDMVSQICVKSDSAEGIPMGVKSNGTTTNGDKTNQATQTKIETVTEEKKPQSESDENRIPRKEFIFIRPMFEHGVQDGLIKALYNIDKKTRRIIHTSICVLFYLLIGLTMSVGSYKIADNFIYISKIKNGQKPGMEIFEPIENIFLYILPMFILFGFYNYYISNTSIYILDGNRKQIDEIKSTKSMNITKMIFLSSIISFVMIKYIEEVFYGEVDIKKITGASVLLIILISYFVIMYRKPH